LQTRQRHRQNFARKLFVADVTAFRRPRVIEHLKICALRDDQREQHNHQPGNHSLCALSESRSLK
jgi:hypothetical protein